MGDGGVKVGVEVAGNVAVGGTVVGGKVAEGVGGTGVSVAGTGDGVLLGFEVEVGFGVRGGTLGT